MTKTITAALAAMLLLPLGANAQEEAQTLTIGDYDSATDGTGVYAGSYNEMAPTTFYSNHTGAQILYTKDDLAAMAGKDITSVNYIFYHLGSYDEITRDIKVYFQLVDAEAFTKNDKNKYQFFDFSQDSLCVDTTFYEQFGIEDDYMNHELKLNLKAPYHYDGTKSLLVTVTFDGDGATDGSDYAAFYSAGSDYSKRALLFCDNNNSFSDFVEAEDWPTVTTYTGTNIDLPLTQFTYVTPAAPEPVEVRALTIDAATLVGNSTILCNRDGSASVKVNVTLTNSGNVDLAPGDENYTLTLTDATGETTFGTATIDSTLAAGETKTMPVTYAISNAKDYTEPVALSLTEGITSTTATVATVTFEEQRASFKVLDAEGEELASGASVGFGTVTEENVSKSFQLVNDGNISFSVRSITLSDGFSTTLSKSLVLAAKDTVDFTITANNYIAGEHEGTMTVTFYNDKLADYTVALTSTVVEPDSVLTLGNYNGSLAEGTEDDCYQGSYYDHCPTTFYLMHTGSQIIYTKEQLTRMAGKGIKEMRFAFYNLSAGDSYPRTVNAWVEEIDGSAFERDTKTNAVKFFDYANGTKAINDYALDLDFVGSIGMSGELALPFDQVVNYSGEKNLLVTITFDGDDTVTGSMDFGFFYNKDVKHSAMTYTSDSYTFADYLDTEDWPYATDGTGTSLEQPVTRFIFGDQVTGISSVKANEAAKTGITYNLAGQRVSDSYKGIVIRDGKKVIRK